MAAKRYPLLAHVGNRERLDPNFVVTGGGDRVPRGPDQRSPKGKHAVAIARRAFSEQEHRIAFGKTLRDLRIDLAGLVTTIALDEHSALQLREQSEKRPPRDFALRHEHDRRERRDDGDVEPR